MKVELPEVKRCCFCIPLRYGLVMWGYIKLALTLLFLVYLLVALGSIAQSSRLHLFLTEIFVLSGFVIVLTLDICFTIVFLVGGHRKTVKPLHIYYVYSIVTLCLYTLFLLWSTGQDLYMVAMISKYIPEANILLFHVIRGKILLGVAVLGIQMYMIILIKNEIEKLRKNTKFRFINMTTEGQSAVENGINEQGTSDQAGGSEHRGNGSDDQFIGIINQSNVGGSKDFSYNKF